MGEAIERREFGSQALEPERSPLLPGPLAKLYLRPSDFFGSELALGSPPYAVFVALVCGMAAASGKVDERMIRADLTVGQPNELLAVIGGSWLGYWGLVVAAGAIGAVFLWTVGGWWYRVRLHWSGAIDADKRQARVVYIYASFVHALPTVVLALAATLLYSSYSEYWAADEMWSSIGLLFPFWACVTGYKGARTVFPVTRWKARVWFLILPILVYVLAFGVVGVMYVLATEI